jgi:hypothetical protein
MANLNNQPGPIMPQGGRYQTFAEFYNDLLLDPFQGQYARVAEHFDPEVNNALSYVLLLGQAVGGGPVPQAYLCCSLRQGSTRIFCVHLPSRYTGSLDGQVSPLDGRSFAFLGEVTQGFVSTVSLPDDSFRMIHNVRSKTSDYIISHLDEITPLGIPPPPQDDPDMTLVSTRALMYLPARYVMLFLNPAGYTIRQAWELLYPALADANDLVNCRPLVNWLRVISMSTEAQAPAVLPGPTSATIDLVVPLADGNLINHRTRLLRQVLPGLYTPPESFERAITQMAVAVTQSTNDACLAREEKAARAAEPKLPSEKYSVTITILQEYLQIADERELPPLWHQWANCTKRQEYLVLMEQLQVYARSNEAFLTCYPIASAKLVQDLLQFTFVGENTDDIRTGLQPFIIADGSSEHRQANLELARTYGLLNAGEHSLLLSDLEMLKSKEVQSIPLSYYKLERNLGMFGNLLGTVMGTEHILTTTYRVFWNMLSQGYRSELQQMIDHKRYIKPAHLLRSIQLQCFNWFYQKKARLIPQQPGFTSMLHTIVMNTYVLPHLPPTLYKLAYPRHPGTQSLTETLQTASLSDTLSSRSSASGSSLYNTSVVSALSIPSGTGTRTLQQRGTHFANVNPDTALLNLVSPGTKIKGLMGDTPPPPLDNGQQPCLLTCCVVVAGLRVAELLLTVTY